jgi:hypothetical protein
MERKYKKQMKDLKIKVIDKTVAKNYILKNHYMKTFANSLVCFGVIDNNILRGVITFGYSTATEQKIKKFLPNIKQNEYLEMQRMNIHDCLGHNTESFVLAKVMKILKEKGIKIVVTHAGGCKNDCGIVYQASSWLYFGKQTCNDFYLTKNGEYKNLVAPLRFGRCDVKGTMQEKGFSLFGEGEIIKSNRYLYMYPIHKGIRCILEKKCLKYPKDSDIFRKDQHWVIKGENGADQ